MIDYLSAIDSGLDLKLVIITISQSFPAKVLHIVVLLILSFDSGTHILFKWEIQSEYV